MWTKLEEVAEQYTKECEEKHYLPSPYDAFLSGMYYIINNTQKYD